MAHEGSRLSSARVLDRTWVPLRHLSRRMAKIPRFARDDSASGDVHIRGEGSAKPLSTHYMRKMPNAHTLSTFSNGLASSRQRAISYHSGKRQREQSKEHFLSPGTFW
jgi:hypothetical protein